MKTVNKIILEKKNDNIFDKIFDLFIFFLTILIFIPLKAPTFYKKLLLIFFIFLMFIPAISFLKPESINYNAFFTIIAIISLIIFSLQKNKLKMDSVILFSLWYIFNGILIRGLNNIKPPYALFIFPLTSISIYAIFLFSKNENGQDVIIFFFRYLIFAVIIESLIGISQSFFSFPIFPHILNTLFTNNRNYFAYIFPSLSAQVTQGSGTFEHFNGLGGLLSLTFPIFFGFWYSNKRKILRTMLLIITFLGLVTTYSRGALIGVLLTFLIFFFFFSTLTIKKKFIISIFIIILLVVFLSNDIENYYLSTGNFAIRKEIWEIVFDYAINNPLNLIFGYGIFFFRDNILGFGGLPKDIHSGQLEILVELGIVGIIIFCKFFFQVISQALKYRDNILTLSIAGGLLSFFFHQLFDNSILGYLGILMIALLGILKFVLNNDDEEIMNWWYGTD